MVVNLRGRGEWAWDGGGGGGGGGERHIEELLRMNFWHIVHSVWLVVTRIKSYCSWWFSSKHLQLCSLSYAGRFW